MACSRALSSSGRSPGSPTRFAHPQGSAGLDDGTLPRRKGRRECRRLSGHRSEQLLERRAEGSGAAEGAEAEQFPLRRRQWQGVEDGVEVRAVVGVEVGVREQRAEARPGAKPVRRRSSSTVAGVGGQPSSSST